MIQMRVFVDVSGPQQLLEWIQNQLASFETPLAEMGQSISDTIAAMIDAGAFIPLADATVRKKGHSTILKDDEDLYDAIAQGEWVIGRSSSRGWQAVLDLPGYGAFHWSGTTFMPARDYADVSASDIEGRFDAIITNWFTYSGDF